MPLFGHSMVSLGDGLAIIGGRNGIIVQNPSAIHSLTCSNQNCIISLLNKELAVPRENIVAIPIPDIISRCITVGKHNY